MPIVYFLSSNTLVNCNAFNHNSKNIAGVLGCVKKMFLFNFKNMIVLKSCTWHKIIGFRWLHPTLSVQRD